MQNRRTGLLAAFLMIATSATAAEPAPAAHILHARLKPAAWAAKYVKLVPPDNKIKLDGMRVPETIVFNAAGRQLIDRFGYSSDGAAWLESVLKQQPAANAPLLSDLVRDLTTPEGNVFPPVFPNGEPVVVVFGAVWCAPCHALKADLQKVDGITLLDLDVNQANMNWKQVMEAVQKPAAN